jgi:hypothetical protein
MKEKDDGGAVTQSYEPQHNMRCGNCWAPAYTHVAGTAVCETHARAYGVIE